MKVNFWEEFQRLILDYPVPSYFGHSNSNSLGGYIHNTDDCYMCFDSTKLSNCTYCFDCSECNNCADMDFALQCDNCFMSMGYKLNDCRYIFDGGNLTNCEFCVNCGNCQDCFGCVDIGNKQYCFFNKQLSKDKYFETVKNYKANHTVEEIIHELKQHAEQFPVAATLGAKSADANCDYADEVPRSRNMYMCFSCADCMNVLYSRDSYHCVDSSDLSYCYKCEGCYSCVDLGHSNNCVSCYFSDRLLDCWYNYYCNNSQSCLGCVGLDNKRFCVLNRQVDEAKYNEVLEKIRKNPNVEIDIL